MFINTATYRTCARGVTGVNQFNHDPSEFGFILDKGSQLSEGPRVLLSPLAMSNRDSGTDTLEVFKGDTPSSAFSLFNNPLRDYVVDISSEALFLFRAFHEKSFGLFGAIGLKSGAKFSMAFSKPVDLPPTVDFSIRVGSYIYNTKVNTNEAVRLIWCRLRGVNHNCQIEDALTENKVGLSHLPINSGFLVSTNPDRDNLTAVECEDRNSIQAFPGKDALVVDHSSVWLEEVLSIHICLIALRNFGYSPYGHLGRKIIVLTKVAIDNMVEIVLPESFTVKSNITSVVAGFVKPLHHLKERLVLLLARSEFDHQCLLHNSIVELFILYVNTLGRRMGEFFYRPKVMKIIVKGE